MSAKDRITMVSGTDASALQVVIYLLATGPFGAPASPELALLAWLSGAAFILLVETSPI